METITKSKIKYTDEQLSVIEGILNWIKTPINSINYKEGDKEKYFEQFNNLYAVLSGSAGTGKTTVLSDIVNRIKLTTKLSFCITAPTHKAKKVASKAVNLQSLTLQSLLGLRPNVDIDNFDINRPQFDPIAEEQIKKYNLVIIDESSMINSDMFELILKKSRASKTKILFVGDMLQLPPINKDKKETISRVFVEIANHFALTKIIRQADTNPLAPLLFMLREDILNKTDHFINYINSKTKEILEIKKENGLSINEGYEVIKDKKQFGDKLITFFIDEGFLSNKDYCKYVAFTNKSIKVINAYVKNNISPSDHIISPTDLLTGYSTILIEDELIITNSEDYIIVSAKSSVSDKGIAGYEVRLRGENGYTDYRDIFIVDHNDIDDFRLVFDDYLDKAKERKGRYWKYYYDFKNKHLLIEDIRDGEKLIVKKDLDFAYGMTVHKTQGSTYDNVFINLKDIMTCFEHDTRRKLIYVALSRAKYFAYLYI